MKWKICLMICVSIFLLTFLPRNIIGCGPESDPYDYYTGFFLNNLSGEKAYHPFLYTSELFLYDTEEPADAAHATSAEWVGYCGNTATKKEAYDFVCGFTYDQLATLYNNLEKSENNFLADSLKQNSITKYFIQHKDLEALGYLMYAKKVEPYVTPQWNDWDTPRPDSMVMARLIKDGNQLYTAAKSEFIQLRYAYQVTRLALYSGNAKDCIRYYDEMVSNNKTKSILQALAASLKAGALFRTGKNYEAALMFSKQFSTSPVKRISNYLSFDWCVSRLDENDRAECLALCKTDQERANLLALFALGSIDNEEVTLKKIFALSPKSEILQVLAVREINKIEENYFSQALDKQKGGEKLYLYLDEDENNPNPWYNEAASLANFYHHIAQSPATPDKALFETGAAYLSYIIKDYTHAKQYLHNVGKLNALQKIKDQATLTQLLVTINEQPIIDSNFEAALLPSVLWLQKKALKETKNLKADNYYEWQQTPWGNFYRNLFAEILAKRYHAQHEVYKEALCIGNAEKITGGNYATEDFVENNIQTKDVLALYNLVNRKNKTAWERFICDGFNVSKDKIKEVISVSYTRDYNFSLALQWLNKIKTEDLIHLERNPFADILFDVQDSIFSFDNGHFDKISFLKEILRLSVKEKENKATADDLYKLATGYYNITYYGRAWEVVKYFRSGDDGYYVPPDALPYDREYYGCYTAEKYFSKAMLAYNDKSRQARCLFMIAKCEQKRNTEKPDYGFGFYGNSKAFLSFKYSKYFPQLVNSYKGTVFFNEAYNSCSYLRDFVNKK
jgi:hypothetical protein